MAKSQLPTDRATPKTPKLIQNGAISKSSSAMKSTTKQTPKSIKSIKQKLTRPVAKTGNPYPTPKWPTLPSEQQIHLAQLLRHLLAPIGQWRSQIPKSKGKRATKRKREQVKDEDVEMHEKIQRPEIPGIADWVTVGLNSTTRALEAQCSMTADNKSYSNMEMKPLRAVFLTQAFSSLFYAHLPLLAIQSTKPVKLVQLQNTSEQLLCEALGLPRVGVLGVKDGIAGFQDVWDIVNQVPLIEMPWVKDASTGQWRGVTIECSDEVEAEKQKEMVKG